MDHLERARTNVKASHEVWNMDQSEHAAHLRELAVAHAVIALVERMDKITTTDNEIRVNNRPWEV